MPSLHGLPRESTSIGHLVDPSSHQDRGCEECDSVATSAEIFADYGLCVWCAGERGLIEDGPVAAPVAPSTCRCGQSPYCQPWDGMSQGCSDHRGTAWIEYRRAVMGS